MVYYLQIRGTSYTRKHGDEVGERDLNIQSSHPIDYIRNMQDESATPIRSTRSITFYSYSRHTPTVNFDGSTSESGSSELEVSNFRGERYINTCMT